jgi:tRNA (mo5U34)-methyltransferase
MNDLRARAAAIDWWHSGIELGQGIVTKGKTQPERTLLPFLRLPDDLTGASVLDICTWDGYMAFECERRGASVVAVDSFAWDKERSAAATGWHTTGRDGFDLAHKARQSTVLPVHCDVLDLDTLTDDALRNFDIVLFLGVLYHMRHPLLALERVAPLVAPGGKLIVESHADLRNVLVPAMRFYPGSEANEDATNWWGPNPACLEAMLHSVGFAYVEVMNGFGDRMVAHAWRE